MNKVIPEIRRELKQNIDSRYNANMGFKEEVHFYGVRIPIVRKISQRYFEEVKDLEKNEIFSICEKLFQSGYFEEATIALDWAFRLKRHYEKSDFKIFESWLKKYVSNWAECDDFCCHAFGYFIFQFPGFLPRLKLWARSRNRWMRRASAVIMIYSIRREKYLDVVFEIADALLMDKDDLVQKGYGWMLKEASKRYQAEIFDYVMRHKDRMPRTALRYAIERFPERLRKKAMEK